MINKTSQFHQKFIKIALQNEIERFFVQIIHSCQNVICVVDTQKMYFNRSHKTKTLCARRNNK